jgi:hypothetical protein
MKLALAYKILRESKVVWIDYFDLIKHRGRSRLLDFAITRVQTFLTIGY